MAKIRERLFPCWAASRSASASSGAAALLSAQTLRGPLNLAVRYKMQTKTKMQRNINMNERLGINVDEQTARNGNETTPQNTANRRGVPQPRGRPPRNRTSGNNSQNPDQAANSLQAPPDAVETRRGPAPVRRRRLTAELNENLMRHYYRVTELETNMTGYRTRLRQTFVQQYPEIDVSEQRLSDQVRVIFNNNLISQPNLQLIKESISGEQQPVVEELRGNNDTAGEANTDDRAQSNYVDPTTLSAESVNEHQEMARDIEEGGVNNVRNEAQEQNETVSLENKTRETFRQFCVLYANSDPILRPPIPQINTSKKASAVIQILNEQVIPELINNTNDLEGLHAIAYCAAVTVCDIIGVTLHRSDQPRSSGGREATDRNRKPRWLNRLNTKIDILRGHIRRVIDYIRGKRSKRLNNGVHRICRQYNTHSSYENNGELPNRVLDTLQQKLALLVNRRKKYNLSHQRKRSNFLFRKSEKKFYREVGKCNTSEQGDAKPPAKEIVEGFWGSIWEDKKTHKMNAAWIEKEKNRYNTITVKTPIEISIEELKAVINKAQNWKSPGPDKVQNFWFKRLTSLHAPVAAAFNRVIEHPDTLPVFLTQGITYLLPKDTITTDPSKYRPITCLPTLYKFLTACISNSIYLHCQNNRIIAEEQKGGIKNSRGCKEQLVIDQVVMGQAINSKRNCSVAYIDYQKAFDSIPHTLILEILRIYRIDSRTIDFYKSVMTNWKTEIVLNADNQTVRSDMIRINSGICQGGSDSAMLFVLMLNPLSNILRETGFGFAIKSNRRELFKLNQLLFMDDLKIYASSSNQLNQMLSLVQKYTADIGMSLGLNKCARIDIVRGKVSDITNQTPVGLIRNLDASESYKYLGFHQNSRINHKEVKKELRSEFTKRIHKLCKSHLNGRNLVSAVNTYAIPVMTYSFGIVNWTPTDLHDMQRIIRTTLTKYNCHHPKSCVERTSLPRSMGGRGLLDILNIHEKQIDSLRSYFGTKAGDSVLHRAIVDADNNITPLDLKNNIRQSAFVSVEEKMQSWSQKAIHGVHHYDLKSPHVDHVMSNYWLSKGDLYAETEGLIFAIQDRVLMTRNHLKYVIKDPTAPPDNCRRCGQPGETIDHIISACPTLVSNDYLKRHNDVAKIIHIQLCLNAGMLEDPPPYYKYQPEPVLDNNNTKIYFDRTLLSNQTRQHNRPDITVINKAARTGYFIDVACPLSRNMQRTYVEKIHKYSELAVELTTQWNLQQIKILPVVLSSTGLVHCNVVQNLNVLGIPKYKVGEMQKAVLLNTAHITRNFLQ